jgi:hypothetical protein
LALRTMSFSSFLAFGDFAAFWILLMSFPIARLYPSLRGTHDTWQAVIDRGRGARDPGRIDEKCV